MLSFAWTNPGLGEGIKWPNRTGDAERKESAAESFPLLYGDYIWISCTQQESIWTPDAPIHCGVDSASIKFKKSIDAMSVAQKGE